ncbi:type VII secretion-associated serine protease mycosin [Micromonospora sp. WMMD1102]|uniref:type VII secretion-associated serine protease mycosin n=1 Tax=Micromonospora sp. WMMD1102 TaxID=3016105 RepID=UPI002414F47D|nr:type VII secretion-associated serine protease mycosin [Micromonospora sp. WMMD1102]MDG4784515.1 type VII secretion-associated serine protease mycosin [Micromonospora sp. WMMD1102]
MAVVPALPAHADQIRRNQWHLQYLKATEAHKITQGNGITVAVVDTGVDPHPDLRNNLLSGTDTYPGGRGTGRTDDDGHGTAVAGIIAAHGRSDNSGILGIAPKAKILPIRYVAPSSADDDPDDITKGINWAVARGAKVINISSTASSTTRLRQAVEAAIRADVVVVAGAGNRSGGFMVGFPAAYPGVVAVSATDRQGNHSNVSVTGSKIVIAAPGVDISSTQNNGKYQSGDGTSFSTAIVAGAAALVRSKYPELSAEEVVHRLTATADDKGAPGRDEEYGYGVLNLVKALTADVPPLEGGANPSASTAPSAPQTPPAGNAAPEPEEKSNVGPTILIGVLVALVVLGLLVTLLVVFLLRRRQQPYRS